MRLRNIILLLAAAILMVACGDSVTPTVATVAPATATIAAPAAVATDTAISAAPTDTVVALPTDTTAAEASPTALEQPTATVAAPTATTEQAAPTATEAAPESTATSAPVSTEPGPMVAQKLIVPDALRTDVFAQDRTLTLPQDFNISLFSNGLNDPRWIVSGPDGKLWVSERSAGRILVYEPQGSADAPAAPTVFISGLNEPHGIEFHDGYVYISETTRILRVKNDNGKASGTPEVIIDGIPSGGHSTRTLLFTPEGKLLVSIGSSCNVCRESSDLRAAVWIYDADGSNGRLFASGLRNAVGLALNPDTQQVWFDNNGRDSLGDNIPKEMIGTLKDGAFYGWPDCYGNQQVDNDFGGSAAKCTTMTVPEVQVQAHSAPLGSTFLPASGWAQPYAGDLIVAYHGSWNRSVPTGYKVVRVPMTGGAVDGEVTDFITGWQANGGVWGRPVAPAVGSDGALYITDDQAGAIYRVFKATQ